MAISSKTKLVWDESRLAYLYNGKANSPVDPSDIRKWIDRIAETAEQRLYALGEALREGRITLAKWQAAAAKEIKNVHTATFAIAMGGQDRVDSAARARLRDVIKFQLEHLRDFAAAVPRRVADRDGRIPPRLAMYGTASIGTYENAVLERNREFGLSIARRVTGRGVRSCDVCLDEEDLGWQDIHEIRAIGDSPCGARCNCVIEYEQVIP